MKNKILGGLICLALLCSLILGAAPIQANDTNDLGEDCSSLAAGKLATVDGSVLFGHNEDDGPCPTLMHVVPRVYHEPGEKIVMWDTDGTIDQVVGETYAYLWSEMPGYIFSDSYLNEWGVSIASNSCSSSRETTPYDLTDGGIGYWLRRLVPERATTAREGVLIMGEFVEKLGYTASGRTYTIADPKEAWLFSAVAGKHWVAQRVPDDEVAYIPNYYTIRQVSLSDTANFLACPDLIQHAIDKGWYDSTSGPFDFAKVYNTPATQASLGNQLRHWGALRLLTGIECPDMSDLPFSVEPNRLLSVEDITEVLRCHYEGTVWAWDPSKTSTPHTYMPAPNFRPICRSTTQESFVMQLRSNMPSSIGNVYWRAQCRPCESAFIPWYSGILKVAEPYTIGEPGVPDNPESAYWTFQKMCQLVDADYANRIGTVREVWDQMEAKAFAQQKSIERTALTLYNKEDEHHQYLATKFLTQYTEGLALKAFRFAHEFIELWEPGWAGV